MKFEVGDIVALNESKFVGDGKKTSRLIGKVKQISSNKIFPLYEIEAGRFYSVRVVHTSWIKESGGGKYARRKAIESKRYKEGTVWFPEISLRLADADEKFQYFTTGARYIQSNLDWDKVVKSISVLKDVGFSSHAVDVMEGEEKIKIGNKKVILPVDKSCNIHHTCPVTGHRCDQAASHISPEIKNSG